VDDANDLGRVDQGLRAPERERCFHAAAAEFGPHGPVEEDRLAAEEAGAEGIEWSRRVGVMRKMQGVQPSAVRSSLGLKPWISISSSMTLRRLFRIEVIEE